MTMNKPELLRNVEHKDLRIITARGAKYGDNVMFGLTFPSEFRDVEAHYPIVFRQTDDGKTFEPIALFGFQDGENLFLNDKGWDAYYLPMLVERGPFLIGRSGDDLLVHVDMAHPRVSKTEGEPLFLEYGGNSEYLEHVNSTLLAIHEGLEFGRGFMAALIELELLESFVLDVELNDGSQNRMMGFYTINEDKLAKLGGDILARLNSHGYLLPIYLVVASLSKMRDLIERKNRLNAAHG